MPCIIDQSHEVSRSKVSYWVSLCGKNLYFCHNPFASAEAALKSGKPICKACRKLANLSPIVTDKTPFKPCVLFVAYKGELNQYNVVSETNTNYRIEGGGLLSKHLRTKDLYWLRSGKEASTQFLSTNKAEAVAMAKTQLQQHRVYLQNLIVQTLEIEKRLG